MDEKLLKLTKNRDTLTNMNCFSGKKLFASLYSSPRANGLCTGLIDRVNISPDTDFDQTG